MQFHFLGNWFYLNISGSDVQARSKGDMTPTIRYGASLNYFKDFLVIPLRAFDFDLD